MKAIPFVGHGELPSAMMQSVQMIAGDNEHLYAVSLEPEDGKEEYAKKLAQVNDQLKNYETVTVFADLMGDRQTMRLSNSIWIKIMSKSFQV
ncbi:hypothetical protein VXN63_05995 [Marinilactibacillus sp. XAAS-LB27]|nr:hypothetical protein [Marinilactibacillus sp. XAAS-LB27]